MFKTPKQTPELQYALAVVMSVGPSFFVALRFRARRIRRASLELDDWLIVVSLIFVYITALFLILGTAHGYQGRHMQFTLEGAPVLSDPGYTWFLKMLYAGQLSQIFAIGPTKISVLLFYKRIFRGKHFNLATWVLITLVSIWMIAFFFANLFECMPISRAFVNAPGMGGDPQCIDAVPMYLSQVYSDLVLDALILAIPIPLIWKLHLPPKQKLAVLGIFLLGIITVLSSCAKMIIFNFVGHELQRQADISYFLSPISYWPLIEAGLQIVAACLTMLRPFIDNWRLIFWSEKTLRRKGYMQSIGSTSNPSHYRSTGRDRTITKTSDIHLSVEDKNSSKSQWTDEVELLPPGTMHFTKTHGQGESSEGGDLRFITEHGTPF